MNEALFTYVLRLADNALVLGHRLSEWCGHAPVLEEDLALGNMGLDLIGQARSLYSYAGEIEGRGRDEDALAYLRDAREFRNILLVEQPNGDFAVTMVRHLIYAAFAHPHFAALARSRDAALAAVDELMPYAGEMFEVDAVEAPLIAAGIAVDPAPLTAEFDRTVADVLAEATLVWPASAWSQTGGRSGRHSEHLGHILAELQFLQRAYPGARW